MTRNIRIIIYILVSILAITFSSTMIIFAAMNASNETTYTISYASAYAFLKNGDVVNAKMKELVTGSTTAYTTADTNITKVVFDNWSTATYGSMFDWDTSTSVVLDENDYGLIKGFYNSSNNTVYILSERIICAKNMSYMFYDCEELTEVDFNNFNSIYGAPTNMAYMFYDCESLSTLTHLSNVDTTTITNMSYVFAGCSSITSFNLSTFTTSSVTNMKGMFSGCTALTSLTTGTVPNNTSNVTTYEDFLKNCSNLTTLNLSGISTINATNLVGMFDGCSSLTSIDVSGFNTSSVANFGRMFKNCTGLTSLDISSFTVKSGATGTSFIENSTNIDNITTPKSVAGTLAVDNANAKFYIVSGTTTQSQTAVTSITSSNCATSKTIRRGYTFTFDANGGSSVSSRVYTYGESISATTSKTGYTFNGWYPSESSNNGTGTQYTTCVDEGNSTSAKTLYAKWTANTYTITYNKNSGTGGTSTATATYGSAMPTITAPTRTGYVFGGYFNTQSIGTDTTNNGSWMNDSVYRIGIGVTSGYSSSVLQPGYVLIFDATIDATISSVEINDQAITGSCTISGGRVYGAVTVPTNSYTGTYSFIDINVSARNSTTSRVNKTAVLSSTGTQYYTTKATSAKNYDVAGATTLYACWIPNSYKVSYNGNGATGGSTATSYHTYDKSSALSTNGFTRTGYDFTVWTTNQDGTGTQYNSGQSVTNLSSTNGATVPLYAQWVGKDYSVVKTLSTGAASCTVNSTGKYNSQLSISWAGESNYNLVSVVIYGRPTAGSSTGEVALATITSGTSTTYTMNGTYYPQIRIAVTYESAVTRYNVTYDFQGGTGGTSSAQVAYGEAMPAVTYPTRAGYTFTGYNSSNTSLKYERAQYYSSYNTFRVEYPISGVSAGTKISMSIQFSETPTQVTFNNATLSSPDWVCIPTANGGSLNIVEHTVTSNLLALWRSLEFSVSSSADWIILTDIKDGTLYYSQEDLNKTMDQESDLTLYAQWIENPYWVQYNANGGSGSMSSTLHYYDTASNLSTNTFTRTGYTFKNWNTQANGSGTTYTDRQSVTHMISGPHGATVPLYAQWTPITYYVAYNANGGSGSVATTTHTYNQSKALASTGYTSTYYDFAGWNTKADGTGTSYSAGQSVKNLSSTQGATVTLYAKWTMKSTTHKVTFDANAGRGIMPYMDSQTFTGNNMTIAYDSTSHKFTLTNTASSDPFATIGTPINLTGGQTYVMHMTIYDTNYNLVQSGSIQVFYAINAAYSEAQSVRFSASTSMIKFTPSTTGDYYIRLDNDTGITVLIIDFWFTTDYTTEKLVTENGTYGDLPTPVRPGYTFNGWYTAKEGGTKIETSTTYTLTTDQTLYGHWEAPQAYTVTFDGNLLQICGGSTPSLSFTSKSVILNSQYGDLPTATKTADNRSDSYSFLGWFTAAEGGTQITSSSIMGTVGGTTLYAHWSYTLKNLTINITGSIYKPSGNRSYWTIYNNANTSQSSNAESSGGASLTLPFGSVVMIKFEGKGYAGYGTYLNANFPSGTSQISSWSNDDGKNSYWVFGDSDNLNTWKVDNNGIRLISKLAASGWGEGYVYFVLRSNITISTTSGRNK